MAGKVAHTGSIGFDPEAQWRGEMAAKNAEAAANPTRPHVVDMTPDQVVAQHARMQDPGRPVSTGAVPGVQPQATPDFSTENFGVMAISEMEANKVSTTVNHGTAARPLNITTTETKATGQVTFVDATTGEPLTTSLSQSNPIVSPSLGLNANPTLMGPFGHDMHHTLASMEGVDVTPIKNAASFDPNGPIEETINESYVRALREYNGGSIGSGANETPVTQGLRISGDNETLETANQYFQTNEPEYQKHLSQLRDSPTTSPLGDVSISPRGVVAHLSNRALDTSLENSYANLFADKPEIADYSLRNMDTGLEWADRNHAKMETDSPTDRMTTAMPPDATYDLLKAKREALLPHAGVEGVQNQLDVIDNLIEEGLNRRTGE
jgi:hypothetical protein